MPGVSVCWLLLVSRAWCMQRPAAQAEEGHTWHRCCISRLLAATSVGV
jgi:hypothetical protein